VAAFNWVNFDATCPSCGRRSGIRAQVHIGASYKGNDTGRLHDRAYSLGDRLPWFDESQDEYASEWRQSEPVGSASEACYSSCGLCHAELYAVIVVRDFVVFSVNDVGSEAAWPAGYPK
jgi:hypothetical protein